MDAGLNQIQSKGIKFTNRYWIIFDALDSSAVF
jgi:hypothetical protein